MCLVVVLRMQFVVNQCSHFETGDCNRFASVPVNSLLVGIFSTQLSVPVFGCVLVVVAKLCLCQEGAELLGLLRAHAQVTAVQILFNVHEEQVPERERDILKWNRWLAATQLGYNRQEREEDSNYRLQHLLGVRDTTKMLYCLPFIHL